LFQAILRGDEQLILQGSDLLGLREPAEKYASAYVDWLEAAMVRAASADAVTSRDAFEELRGALTVDSVVLVIDDYRGRRREAVLLGPTHPLRITWHTTWAHLAQQWLQKARQADREFVVSTRDAALKQLARDRLPASAVAK
jgi:DNA phosphorothioation-dependent restriction protein DptH